jgi:hypothetical protein
MTIKLFYHDEHSIRAYDIVVEHLTLHGVKFIADGKFDGKTNYKIINIIIIESKVIEPILKIRESIFALWVISELINENFIRNILTCDVDRENIQYKFDKLLALARRTLPISQKIINLLKEAKNQRISFKLIYITIFFLSEIITCLIRFSQYDGEEYSHKDFDDYRFKAGLAQLIMNIIFIPFIFFFIPFHLNRNVFFVCIPWLGLFITDFLASLDDNTHFLTMWVNFTANLLIIAIAIMEKSENTYVTSNFMNFILKVIFFIFLIYNDKKQGENEQLTFFVANTFNSILNFEQIHLMVDQPMIKESHNKMFDYTEL